jgi:hypothetical protein
MHQIGRNDELPLEAHAGHRLDTPCDEHDVRIARRECARDGGAEIARGTGHDDGLIRKLQSLLRWNKGAGRGQGVV